MKNWYLIIDVEKCENCNNCFLACKDEHVWNEWPGYAAPQPIHGQKWMDIRSKERGQYPFIDVAYMPVPCMHCDDAPCIRATKNGEIYKRTDGIVIIDPVKAKGKKSILAACPYGAIWWNEELELPQKCTLCAHLLDNGWDKTRCVQSCPTGALSLLKVEPAEMQKIISDERLEAFLPELDTRPHVFYKNLHRYTRCFIAGSVVAILNGQKECAGGAMVSLLEEGGNEIAACEADNYGDFKFDNLEENSGDYSLRISFEGFSSKEITVRLDKSKNIGTFLLESTT